jgi:hypothetical protein
LCTYRATLSNLFCLQDFDSQLKSFEQSALGFQQRIGDLAAKCAKSGSCPLTELGTSDLYKVARLLPPRKEIKVSVGACASDSKGHARWATMGPGCRDLNSGITWSLPLPGNFNFVDAEKACAGFVQNGVPGWVLPTSRELATTAGTEGITSQLPGDFQDWFWANDGKRVTPQTGMMAVNDKEFSFRVVCRLVRS